MRQRSSPIRRAARRTVLLLALAGAAAPTFAASTTEGLACRPPAVPPPECDNPLPQILNIGLPVVEGVTLEELEASLRSVVGERYLACALCPARPLRINVALGSDYQILDWLDRGLVDMGVVPVLGFELLRRDGLDLLEIADPAAREMAQLVGRVPRLTHSAVVDGAFEERSGHGGDLEELARRIWQAERGGHGAGSSTDPGHLVMPSHLSTAGFLMPILAVDEALDALDPEREASSETRRAFWDAFYRRTCFRFGSDLGRRDGTACAAAAGSPRLEVAVVDELSGEVDPYGPPVLGPRLAYRDRLVIRRGAADSVFAPDSFPESEPPPWGELHRLREVLDRAVGGPAQAPIPSAFDGFLTPDGYFGTRTFAFRIGETLDLIELHQRISSRGRLALVLPGGGVKAAYQSRVLDDLYAEGARGLPLLRNAGANPETLPAPDRDRSLVFASSSGGARAGVQPGDVAIPAATPLEVDSVVGTSGGALLGFFVARLGPHGPGELSSILWKPDADDDERYLTASEIFGWTDLPRYVSLVLIFCIFGLALAPFSWRHRGFLAPERRPAGEKPEAEPSVRPVLWLSLLALLGLTPLVVRWVSGPLAEEHVPEFEGLLYAVLLVLGMYADQCLVRRERHLPKDAPPLRGPGRRFFLADLRTVVPIALLLVGGVLVAIPVLVRLAAPESQALETLVTTGGSYLVLGSMAAGVGLLAVGAGRLRRFGWWNVLAWPATFTVGTLASWWILQAADVRVLAWIDRTPLLFLVLGLGLLIAIAVRVAASVDHGPEARRRWERGFWGRAYAVGVDVVQDVLGHRAARLFGLGAVAFLGCLIVLDLTRPEAAEFDGAGVVEVFTAESKLQAPRGPLAVCLGAVFLLLGTILVLHRRRNAYRLEDEGRFRDSVLLVVTGLAFAVYAGLWLVVRLISVVDATGWLAGSAGFRRLAALTLFELTPSFWIGLAVASLVGSLVLVRWAWKGNREGAGAFSRGVTAALAYLCSIHPNAHLVPRRVVRLGAMALGGLVWWNFLLAPALYGNRYAFDYMESAEERFEAEYRKSHDRSSYRLTARYLAPANALALDGTRFVLAVPDDHACPAVPTAPGVTWRKFRAVREGGSAGTSTRADDCTPLALGTQADREELQNYIFASGSPFPAFPPKLVRIHGEEGAAREDASPTREALVDGGYSNNVPIEAAAKIGARQALVIHSSNPRPDSSDGGWLTALGGPLVDNVPRLLGFLYERSQQLDRRSRSDLFVASIAPPPADDWPILTDFRATTVKRMIDQAGEDLDERIGMVESWGPPEFQSSLRVPIECPDECRGEAPDGL